MKLKNAISWFEIPVSDFERAITFYETVLDIELKREKMEGIELAVFPADELAITGALIKADFLQPGEQGSLVYLNVEGIMDEVMQRAQDRGASIRFAKTHLEECGYIAHISDSEGNKIALYSMTE